MLAGNQRVQIHLENALKSGRLAHAYLFLGPKHVGKTAFAEALARGALCQRTAPPLGGCAVCEGCRTFDAPSSAVVRLSPGTSLLSEKSATAEIGIREIRELRRKLSFTVLRRAVIISEIGEMTREAGNAFLKILEEPHAGTYFFLTSSRPQDLLRTVVSRTVPLRLHPVPAEEMAEFFAAPQNLIRLSRGLPGILQRLAADAGFRKEQEEVFSDAQEIVRGSRRAALALAERYASHPELQRSMIMHLLSSVAEYFSEVNQAAGFQVERSRAALSVADALETTNVNARMAWDVLFLNARVNP